MVYPSSIKPVPQWLIKDSTKINSFMECQRRYFYNYVLGWTKDSDSVHLRFGEAMHSALHYLYSNLKEISSNPASTKYLLTALEHFMRVYTKYYTVEEYEANEPKGPIGAAETLEAYMIEVLPDDYSLEVLDTEVTGSVPVLSLIHI